MPSPKLNVLFEDNHLLVLSKPAGIPTMGVVDQHASLLGQAKLYLKKKFDKPGNVYLGVVSRIDSLVSGVIVFARTSKAAARLNTQFRQRTTEKVYWAVVSGNPVESKRTLKNWMCKNESRKCMQVCARDRPGAKLAELTYRVLAERDDRSLLEIRLGTGRKHQIRVQLAHLGHPLIGDRKYGSTIRMSNAIALHCLLLQLNHPISRERLDFRDSIPRSWNGLGFDFDQFAT